VDTTRDGPVWLDPVLEALRDAGLLEAAVPRAGHAGPAQTHEPAAASSRAGRG
jgi:hypothetical protein